ncbi:MAG: hypothetical protein Q8L86_12365 [Vicinamibacterales bacterium]|nr:hypothetical protein [Vicinamibacterales bacterium]
MASNERPLIDPSAPFRIKVYASYRVREVAELTGIGVDKVRDLFASGEYGECIKVESQRTRKFRKNYTTLLIPYDALANFFSRSVRKSA